MINHAVHEPVKGPTVSIPQLPSSIEARQGRLFGIQLHAFLALFREGLRLYRNPWKAARALARILRNRRKIQGGFRMSKLACAGGRYYFSPMAPGFPSPQFQQYGRWELSRVSTTPLPYGLQATFFAITRKCPLRCEHCYEWETLNQKEQLSRKDLLDILHKLQEHGTSTVFLEGGEPMMRYKDILYLLANARGGSDFWIITSGFNLNRERAEALKAAGLTGVMVSLDHHEAEAHNAFRGHHQAFAWAIRAVELAKQAGLVTSLSLCATRSFTNQDNLQAYLRLAHRLGVAFVQILEAQSVGHYAGQDVQLSPAQRQLLTDIFCRYNGEPSYRDYPILFYPAFQQERFGCFGSGNRSLYIDAEGDLHACPFCQDKVCHALAFPLEDSLELLKKQGCHLFEAVPGPAV